MYNSLIIRYNSNKAMMTMMNGDGNNQESGFLGAGQPLHQDKALISINSMLNTSSKFEGSGAFFENQL